VQVTLDPVAVYLIVGVIGALVVLAIVVSFGVGRVTAAVPSELPPSPPTPSSPPENPPPEAAPVSPWIERARKEGLTRSR